MTRRKMTVLIFVSNLRFALFFISKRVGAWASRRPTQLPLELLYKPITVRTYWNRNIIEFKSIGLFPSAKLDIQNITVS